jgi:hypothetical protein
MRTLNLPRRVMRPEFVRSELPDQCKWCGQPIGSGEVFTVGHDLGKFVAVCRRCLAPPALGSRLLELETED